MAELKTFTRWADWEHGVLSRVNDPAKCQQLIGERQLAVDDDATEAQMVAAEFRQELIRQGFDAESACVFVPSRIAAKLLKTVTGVNRATNHATRYLRILKIAELSRTEKDSIPGWCWRGSQAKAEATMTWLAEEFRPAKRPASGQSPADNPTAASLTAGKT